MNRRIAGVIALVLLLTLGLSGACHAEAEKLSVVTTIFPIYDWVREIVGDGDDVEITLLLDNGVDLHSFQPTAQDIVKVSACDVFAYVGGESDGWVAGALAEAENPRMTVVNLVEAMGEDVKIEETVEGMEEEEDDEEAEEAEEEVDEHVWLSLRNARRLVTALAEALGEADPDNARRYADNAEAYGEKLAALDARYAEVRAAAGTDTLLFGDRFPFRYLVDDYDLRYYAAFSGCSAESEASFETIVFLAGKVDELDLGTVMTIEGDNHRIAETIVENTRAKDAQVLTLDSMQATTRRDVDAGATYLGTMEANLETLERALAR